MRRIRRSDLVRIGGCLFAAALMICSCSRGEESGAGVVAESEAEAVPESPPDEQAEERFRLTSSAFEDGEAIPVKHTGDGEDVSPPLAWQHAPEGTAEFALIVDDPDAPRREPWVHWVLYGIPAGRASLPEAVPNQPRPEGELAGMRQGRNDFGRTGYGGPAPPRGHGVHHYRFTLYALDAPLDAQPGVAKADLLDAMEGAVLAETRLIGTYER